MLPLLYSVLFDTWLFFAKRSNISIWLTFFALFTGLVNLLVKLFDLFFHFFDNVLESLEPFFFTFSMGLFKLFRNERLDLFQQLKYSGPLLSTTENDFSIFVRIANGVVETRLWEERKFGVDFIEDIVLFPIAVAFIGCNYDFTFRLFVDLKVVKCLQVLS